MCSLLRVDSTHPTDGDRTCVVVTDCDPSDTIRHAIDQVLVIQGCPDCGALQVKILDDSRRVSAVRICIDPPWGTDHPITPRMIAAAAAASRALARAWYPGEGIGVF